MLLRWFILLPGASEFYEYVDSKTPRLGMNVWLFIAIIIFEDLNIVKHIAVDLPDSVRPVPSEVSLPWALFGMLITIWCFGYYLSRNINWFQWSHVIPLPFGRIVLSRDFLLKFSLAISVSPLLFLAKNYAY